MSDAYWFIKTRNPGTIPPAYGAPFTPTRMA